MSIWESKTCSEKFASLDGLRMFIGDMNHLHWEIVSAFPDPFPPEKSDPGSQPEERIGIPFIVIFKKEIPDPEKTIAQEVAELPSPRKRRDSSVRHFCDPPIESRPELGG